MRFHLLLISFVGIAASNPIVVADDSVESATIKKIELMGGNVTRDELSTGSPVVSIDLSGSEDFYEKYMNLLKQVESLKAFV